LRVLSYLAALVIVIASGIISGSWTDRWSTSGQLAARVAELDRVPMTIGDWQGRALALDRRSIAIGEIAGYLNRRYENWRNGEAVSVLLVCGRPGPIWAHTPEVCYAGGGYEPSTRRTKVAVAAGARPQPDEFWSIDLLKRGTIASEHLRILYAWNADGTWRASASPRWDFGGMPALYKLYVIRDVAGAKEQTGTDPAVAFARQFLPALRDVLFSTGGPTPGRVAPRN
jgi:Protein of unknown function (DUF3485)